MTRQGSFLDKLKTNVRSRVAKLVSIRYGNPGKKLKLIGVTGSKGKTVTSLMIYHILKEAGFKVGCITTISAKIGDQELDTGFHVTSPEPWVLPKYLKQMVNAGIEYVVLETTSNGLQQGRFAGLNFDTAVITNIDIDHLDYHATWENYASAKFKLVEQLVKGGLAVANADHESQPWIAERIQRSTNEPYALWFSKEDIVNFSQTFEGMEFDYLGTHFSVKAIGSHFLENVLAAIKACSRYMSVEEIAKSFENFVLPPGRMQVMQRKPFTVIVDFAHTPASLDRSLETIYELKGIDSRVITIFGCAGERDPSRRQMGIPAAKYSKLVILTAEDPRTEELSTINSEIFQHAEPSNAVLLERFDTHHTYTEANLNNLTDKINRVIQNQDVPFVTFDEMSTQSRMDAIDFAIKFAQEGDVIFITGKGHEKSLCFGSTEYDWSDQSAVKQILQSPSNDDFTD